MELKTNKANVNAPSARQIGLRAGGGTGDSGTDDKRSGYDGCGGVPFCLHAKLPLVFIGREPL
jgi:hypothetical protein